MRYPEQRLGALVFFMVVLSINVESARLFLHILFSSESPQDLPPPTVETIYLVLLGLLCGYAGGHGKWIKRRRISMLLTFWLLLIPTIYITTYLLSRYVDIFVSAGTCNPVPVNQFAKLVLNADFFSPLLRPLGIRWLELVCEIDKESYGWIVRFLNWCWDGLIFWSLFELWRNRRSFGQWWSKKNRPRGRLRPSEIVVIAVISIDLVIGILLLPLIYQVLLQEKIVDLVREGLVHCEAGIFRCVTYPVLMLGVYGFVPLGVIYLLWIIISLLQTVRMPPWIDDLDRLHAPQQRDAPHKEEE